MNSGRCRSTVNFCSYAKANHIGKSEPVVSDELWTLPKYRELLFIR